MFLCIRYKICHFLQQKFIINTAIREQEPLSVLGEFMPLYNCSFPLTATLRHRRARYLSVLFRLLRVKVRLRQSYDELPLVYKQKRCIFEDSSVNETRNRIRKPVRRWTERATLSYELHLKNFRNSSSEIFLSPLVSTAFMNSYNATATVDKLLQ